MPLRLNSADPDFEQAFARLVALKRESDADVGETVAAIIADVRARGDAALIDYTAKFDRLELTPERLRVSAAEIDAAVAEVDAPTAEALALAAKRIAAYHEKQLPADTRYEDEHGNELGAKWTAIGAAGLYVPGGQAAYPSSVLMNAIPARVAGVPRVAMVVPTPDGVLNPLVLLAARTAGIEEIYRVGGAQAVAALAYGTESIAPVDKVVGPGNAWVATAKRQVFGTVGIDLIAGPSEILVLADAGNDPAWIAADLLSQAEHDEVAQAILITDDAEFADTVAAAVEAELKLMPRGKVAGASWRDYGAIVVIGSLDEAPALVDRLAPEHLEIATADPEPLAARIRNAGAMFLGRFTPEAISDYVAGPNHVLPTARSARFSSGLSVQDFVKRTSIVRCTPDGLAAIAPAAVRLAEAEGLAGHARSLTIRTNRTGD